MENQAKKPRLNHCIDQLLTEQRSPLRESQRANTAVHPQANTAGVPPPAGNGGFFEISKKFL